MTFINQRDDPHWLHVTRTDMDGEEGRAGKVTLRDGVVALCTPEVLAGEATTRYTPYYLFWRG